MYQTICCTGLNYVPDCLMYRLFERELWGKMYQHVNWRVQNKLMKHFPHQHIKKCVFWCGKCGNEMSGAREELGHCSQTFYCGCINWVTVSHNKQILLHNTTVQFLLPTVSCKGCSCFLLSVHSEKKWTELGLQIMHSLYHLK
jgi:hypothetical protein